MFENSFIAHEDIMARQNQDGTVILMKLDEGDTFFKINGVAADLWMRLKTAHSGNDLVSCVVNEYEVTEAKAREDIQHFLSTLLDKELIKKV